jgi:hypothetical protein
LHIGFAICWSGLAFWGSGLGYLRAMRADPLLLVTLTDKYLPRWMRDTWPNSRF